jgi:transcriptional regulator with XRE-family HTH domain
VTAFQTRINELIAKWEKDTGNKLSGGRLATMLNKSRNLLSQIVNDGLVPSGAVLVELADALGCDEDETTDLLLSAMQTKAATRSRDTFWLREALALVKLIQDRAEHKDEFLREHGLMDAFRKWLAQKLKNKKKKGAKKKDADASDDSRK